MEVTPFTAETDAEAGQLREDADTTASLRIIDPKIVDSVIRQQDQARDYYQFPDTLDVDRYQIDGASQDTVVAVRDLDMSKLGDSNTWNNRVAVYTHRDPAKVIGPWTGKRIHNAESVEVFSFDPGFIDDAVQLLERRSTVTLTVAERQLYLDLNGTSLSSTVHTHSAV